MTEIIKFKDGELIENQVQKITEFLNDIGLPSDNIIAKIEEREIIGKNLPSYIYNLPLEVKRDARYLSKFVIGAGFGLFDYALNSVWNEVVISLRNKAITYGLEIFFDSAVGGNLREAYQKEEDLGGLKDIVLLNTCRKLELISDTTYKKLAHILDMRNDIGISHPTNYTINAFELLGWLQTCIQDVLQDKPSDAAIQVKAFISNLKSLDTILDQDNINTLKPQIEALATHHCDSILRTIFGMYVNTETNQILKKNISLISKIVWDCSSDEEKYRLGIILEGYNNNLYKSKYNSGEEFFLSQRGNKFRTKSEKIVVLNNLIQRLRDTHYSWDNFYYEVPIISQISTYFENSADIPSEISSELIRTILLCRLGRGVSYKNGVSPGGKSYYDLFFSIIGEKYFPQFIVELVNFEIIQNLSNKIRMEQCLEILNILKKNIVNEKYIEVINYLLANLNKTEKILLTAEFQKLTKSFIKWP